MKRHRVYASQHVLIQELHAARARTRSARIIAYIEPPQRKRPTNPQMHSRFRDRLTGEPLRDDALKLPISTVDRSRPPGTRYAIPTAMHTLRDETIEHCEDSRDRLGSPAWSLDFARYIGNVKPLSITEPRRLWVKWWEIAGAWGYLADRYPHECVDAAYTMCLNPDADLDAIAKEFGKSKSWLLRQYKTMAHTVRCDLWQPAS